MINQQIDYASLVEKALLQVVRDVLEMVAEHGLPGRHHLYITFRTDHPGVVMDDTLHARYPSEMTIVLQHEFWDLEVWDDRFTVTLSFNSVGERLEIPLSAVTVFADPSVEFGLQFTRAHPPAADEATPTPVAKLPVAAAKTSVDESSGPDPVPSEAAEAADVPVADADQEESADKVVTLDRFRKK
jgi:hypothetical protein